MEYSRKVLPIPSTLSNPSNTIRETDTFFFIVSGLTSGQRGVEGPARSQGKRVQAERGEGTGQTPTRQGELGSEALGAGRRVASRVGTGLILDQRL